MKLSKKQIEQYHFRQTKEDTTDCMWADFNIEDNGEAGRVSIHSDYGDWSYYWGCCGEPFKVFLTDIDDHYLMGKLGRRTEFGFDYQRLKSEILETRMREEISAETARECWDEAKRLEAEHITDANHFYYYYQDHCTTIDKEIYGHDMEGLPTLSDYPIHLKRFVKEVWPEFINTLKAELTEANQLSHV